MSPSLLPPFSSSLKRPLPSGGFQDSNNTLRRKPRLQHEAFPHRIISLSSSSLPQVSSASSHGPKSLLQNKTDRSLKRPLPSGGFQDSNNTFRQKPRLQHEAFPHRIISLSSSSLPQVSSASSHGPKSLLQNKTERNLKTSPALNLEHSGDPSTSIRRMICLSPPSAATTSLKGSRFAKDSERDFQGPKSLAEILKEKRQRSANVNVDGAVQESELEEREFSPSNDTAYACQDSSSHSTSAPSSASISPSHDSGVRSILKSANTPAPSMPPAEEAESQLIVASKDIDDAEFDDEIDDVEFDSDIDIDDAELELFFDEQDYIH